MMQVNIVSYGSIIFIEMYSKSHIQQGESPPPLFDSSASLHPSANSHNSTVVLLWGWLNR